MKTEKVLFARSASSMTRKTSIPAFSRQGPPDGSPCLERHCVAMELVRRDGTVIDRLPDACAGGVRPLAANHSSSPAVPKAGQFAAFSPLQPAQSNTKPLVA